MFNFLPRFCQPFALFNISLTHCDTDVFLLTDCSDYIRHAPDDISVFSLCLND